MPGRPAQHRNRWGRRSSPGKRGLGSEAATSKGKVMALAALPAEGTGLLGKLQSPGEPPCHVPRLCVTRQGCLGRSSWKSAEPDLTQHEPGISGLLGTFHLHLADWHLGPPGWCHRGLQLQVCKVFTVSICVCTCEKTSAARHTASSSHQLIGDKTGFSKIDFTTAAFMMV